MLIRVHLQVRVLGLLAALFVLSSSTVYACQNCEAWGALAPTVGICRPADSGVTVCNSGCDWVGCWCNEAGNYCDDVTVIGDDPGDGESNPCASSNFCPAQCFSCGGGGGIPRV